jgi:uncharacterized membrane protein
MRLLLLLSLLLLPNLSIKAQFQPQQEVERIDLKLERFRKEHQTGTLLIIIDSVLSIIPLVSNMSYNGTGFYVASGVLGLTGYLITIDSYHHLRLKTAYREKESKDKPKPKPKNWFTPRNSEF